MVLVFDGGGGGDYVGGNDVVGVSVIFTGVTVF